MATGRKQRAEHAGELALTMTGVTRRYGRGGGALHALRGVDVALSRGSFTAVMGPSGSGKSTLLQCSDLTAREHETLTLMAEGLTNTAIADRMRITQRAVEKHTAAIFDKLDIPRTTATHRRVQAVLRFVENQPPTVEE